MPGVPQYFRPTPHRPVPILLPGLLPGLFFVFCLQRDVPQIDIPRGVEVGEVGALEALCLDAYVVGALREVFEPEVAIGIGEGLDHLAAGGAKASFSMGSYTVPAMNRPGMFR
jgi:hypothetical protein